MRYALIVAALLASPAVADDTSPSIKVGQFAALLAAEGQCSMHYNADAVASYVARTFVTPEELDAMAALPVLTSGHASLISKQSATAKVATCAAARSNAKRLGFVY